VQPAAKSGFLSAFRGKGSEEKRGAIESCAAHCIAAFPTDRTTAICAVRSAAQAAFEAAVEPAEQSAVQAALQRVAVRPTAAHEEHEPSLQCGVGPGDTASVLLGPSTR